MNISKFFIERPVFSAVISGFILIAGLISLFRLPISEYPEVVPPSIVVRAAYPGANPQVISETVAAPLEQEIVGVEDMLYMSSQATLDGNLSLTITFRIGTDIDRAQVQVQNRVSSALPRLPEEVRQLGVSTTKTSPDLMMAVNLVSTDARHDALYLRNYALLNVKDELARLPGMGSVQVFGSGDYAMRIWLDPEKLAVRSLTTGDIMRAIREQNLQVAAGQIGAPPSPGADFQIALDTMGRLGSEEQFRDIVIKTGEYGEVLRLGDVARVEMGASTYALRGRVDHDQTVTIPIFQAPGSNALELAGQVRGTMDRLQAQFPAGMSYRIIYDPTVFVRQSIDGVIVTLLEAVALVVLVVLLFLQTWRASIIPLAAVPVSVIGTFAVLHAFGFSINTLSLFGLVLAIGIVVDDAIVVVENVERHIARGLSPMEATRQAMREVSRPIIAITLVLCAVFVPVAFVDGLTGQFYRQFALTIAISTVISAFNSLTLSPALAALLLKPHGAKTDRVSALIERVFGGFFRRFNRGFDAAGNRYQQALGLTVRRTGIVMILYVGLVGLTALGLNKVPAGFIPAQDKLYLVSVVQLPPGSAIDRTEDVVRRVAEIGLQHPGVEGALQFAGMSPNNYNTSTNSGLVFFALKPFQDREDPSQSANAIAGTLNQQMAAIQEAYIGVFPPPPVQGLGSMGGFKLNVEDRGNHGAEALYKAVQEVLAKAWQDPRLANVYSTYQVNVPQIRVEVDRVKVKQQEVQITDVFQTLQAYLGSAYVNDFNRFGRTYRVMVQADAQFRNDVDDILQLKTRNARGEMVPLGSMVKLERSFGPDFVERFNAYRSADITGGAAPGHSSGEAQAAIAQILADTLPQGMSFEWTELAYQQQTASGTALLVFPLCVLFVFLVLAAQYESFTLPLAIILIVPLALLAGLAGVMLEGSDSNVFTQVGFLVLVALASKNAILIVEFAKHLQEDQGLPPMRAVLDAARLRLRPILMTSIAFIMGVVPLVLAHGAGAEVRQAMGATVFAGMIGVTAFGLFLTPVFYLLVQKKRSAHAAGAVVAAALLAGCAVGPDYREPATELPRQFAGAESVRYTAEDDDLARFWTVFDDATLTRLVGESLRANHDLRIALARLNEARALRGAARLDLGPAITGGAGYADQRLAATQANGGPRDVESYDGAFDAFWELDFFGRNRRALEASNADLQAAEAGLQDAQVSVAAELSRSYFELRGNQQRLAVAMRNVANQNETLELTRARLEAGTGTDLDTSRATAQLAATRASIAPLEAAVARAIHRIGVLTGREPGALRAELELPAELPAVPQMIAVGDPARLLRRRPDIRVSERQLAATTARIGVAVADLFPRVTFTGSLGYAAGSFDALGDSGSGTHLIAPGISWAAFDLGHVRARIAAARARSEGALAGYEQTVLRALQETEDALVTHARSRDQLVQLEQAVDASQTAARLARLRFENGAADFLQVLDAERSLLQAEDSLAQSRTDTATSLITVYKTLGGGWVAPATGG